MNKITMILNGEKIATVRFAYRGSAERYAAKTGLKIVYFRAHEYYVG